MEESSPKKAANRASLTRQPTTGPLEAENNPSNLSVAAPSPSRHSSTSIVSPASPFQGSSPQRPPIAPVPPSPSDYHQNADDPEPQTKDLSFLLHPSFYLPIAQAGVPARFRIELDPVPSKRPISQSLAELEKLLSEGDFLIAAHVAAEILTCPELDPTNIQTISYLLSVRYSCLELTGNTHLAAQESKALEDLNSEFYYVRSPSTAPLPAVSKRRSATTTNLFPVHILPFPLRLQASRLQSLGFSDPRRAVSALFDLGLQCRQHIVSPDTAPDEREVWERRLEELGMRVVNALIEVNDAACAARTLKTLPKPTDGLWRLRMALLLLKIGDLSAAKRLLDDATDDHQQAKKGTLDVVLEALLATAEGRYEDAAGKWESILPHGQQSTLQPIIQQNLAVNYVYAGRLRDAIALMEDIVDHGGNHGSLTFNLATAYELSSERPAELKMQLADRVLSQSKPKMKGWAKLHADLKL